MSSLYSYVVRDDRGFAPNPDGGCCTLACCKWPIRAHAQVGDWILGTHTTEERKLKAFAIGNPKAPRVCFLMQVAECMDFDTYFNDERFKAKRPTPNNNGDNIYHRVKGRYVQARNRHHCAGDMVSDLKADRVLIGSTYWYFGRKAPELPTHLASKVVKKGPGRRKVTEARVISAVIAWARKYPTGKSGEPARPLGRRRKTGCRC